MLDTPFWIADLCNGDMANCEIMKKARNAATIEDCLMAYEEVKNQ